MSMPGGVGKCRRIREMLRRWRNKACTWTAPCDVPAGHVAVCVGSDYRRFVVRATYLNHPVFKELLAGAEEEYAFSNQQGPLAIPCDELLFQEVIRFISRSHSRNSTRFNCHCHVANNPDSHSLPLLTDNIIW